LRQSRAGREAEHDQARCHQDEQRRSVYGHVDLLNRSRLRALGSRIATHASMSASSPRRLGRTPALA
jgi:hypothetical protein